MRHIITVLVENQFGVLARIAGMFSSRGFNIDSLAVGETADPTVSRMTLVSRGDDQVIEQIIKQLRRLIEVIRVQDITEERHIERELVLVKVKANKGTRGEIMQMADIFQGRIVDVSAKSLIVEVVGSRERVNSLLDLLESFGVLETVRTGAIGMLRNDQALKV